MRKLSTLCRKIHRYLTIPFVVLTIMVMVFTINNLFFRWQRVFMLGLAITGVFMFLYPYIVKWNKRKDNSI